MFLPALAAPPQTRLLTDTFCGLRHMPKIGDGEWYDEDNLSTHAYPLLSPRPRRGIAGNLRQPRGLCARERLWWADGQTLYANGLPIEGLVLENSDKQLVSMGAYLLIFPDALYINTQDFSDYGSLNAALTTPAGAEITYSPCRADGSAYDLSSAAFSPSAPENPENGDFWMDTAASPHQLYQYSQSQGLWTQVEGAFVRVDFPGAGNLFSIWDGVTLSGCAADTEDETLLSQIANLNAAHVLYAVEQDAIVLSALLDKPCRQTAAPLTLSRTCPKMDFVLECGNRLWGCRYGMEGGRMYNEIYACALGDFKNWNRFLGLSTDSYAVSLGSDGPFTGAVNHLGIPVFFKENTLYRVTGSQPSSFQLSDLPCPGVEQGSHESLTLVGSALYYKSADGVYAYDGSLPVKVSQALGTLKFHAARGGSADGRYYLSMLDDSDQPHLLTLDTRLGFWHREDSLRAAFFAPMDGDLFCIDLDTGNLLSLLGTQGEKEPALSWMAQSGVQGYESPGGKFLSRFLLRVFLPPGSSLRLFLRYDSKGEWEPQGVLEGEALSSFLLPVIPRRCDHVELKLEGAGDMKLYSLCRVLETGGDRP